MTAATVPDGYCHLVVALGKAGENPARTSPL